MINLSATASLNILRVSLCSLVFIHGAFRAITGGYGPFGQWLESQHVPFGSQVAILITAYELIAAPLLAFGKFRPWLSLGFIFIYAVGLVMVHFPAGWFVVGGGRNGMEYSVLLIIGFALIGLTRAQDR